MTDSVEMKPHVCDGSCQQVDLPELRFTSDFLKKSKGLRPWRWQSWAVLVYPDHTESIHLMKGRSITLRGANRKHDRLVRAYRDGWHRGSEGAGGESDVSE